MKKIIALLLCVILVFGMTACSQTPAADTDLEVGNVYPLY